MTIKTFNLLKFFIFVIAFQIFSSCRDQKQAFDGEVFRINDNSFGYTVLYKGKIYIKQETIPAMQENKKFVDSLDALKTLDLVLEKLNSGKKPTLSIEEIEKLNIKLSN